MLYSPPLPDLSPSTRPLHTGSISASLFTLDEPVTSGGSGTSTTRGSEGESSFGTSSGALFVEDEASLEKDALTAFCDADYTIREAGEDDAEAIAALVGSMDMTNATSFVWPLMELRERLRTRCPLIVMAEHVASGAAVGVAGIDVDGMEKAFEVMSIGSRVTSCPANETFFVPQSSCMCRGLLIHPGHQGAGLGSRLHKARLVQLAILAPHTPSVVLSARGRTYDESMDTLGPILAQPRDENDATPQYEKSVIVDFTYPSSKGIVYLAHQRESEGWKFVGVDLADGGPVWITVAPIKELGARYCAKPASAVRAMTTSLSAERRTSTVAPMSRRNTLAASG